MMIGMMFNVIHGLNTHKYSRMVVWLQAVLRTTTMQHQNAAVQGCLEIIIDLVFQEPTFFLTWGTS